MVSYVTACIKRVNIINRLFSTQGNGKAVVTRTGINTVMGKITELTEHNPKAETLITREVSQFIHLFTCAAISLGMFFFVVSVFFLEIILSISNCFLSWSRV